MFRNMIPFMPNVRQQYPMGLPRLRNWVLEKAMLRSMKQADLVPQLDSFFSIEAFDEADYWRARLSDKDATALEQSCNEILELKDELGQLGIRRLNAPLTQRFVNADLRFHLLLLRSTGNRRMMKIVADTRNIGSDLYSVSQTHPGNFPQSRVRFFRGCCIHPGANTPFLRATFQRRRS